MNDNSEKNLGLNRRKFLQLLSLSTLIHRNKIGEAIQNVGASLQEQETKIDLIPRDELLSTYHTVIHDLPKNEFEDFVLLDFRRAATETTLFKRLERGKLHLEIFLINDNIVNSDALTPSQLTALTGYDGVVLSMQRNEKEVKDLNAQEIEQNRAAKRQEYQTKLQEIENALQQNSISQDRFDVEKLALDYVYGRYLRDEPSDDDLRVGKMLEGVTITRGDEQDTQGQPFSHSFVFIAARNMPKTKTFSSGSETLTIPSNEARYSSYGYEPVQPNPDQSFPSENWLTVDLSDPDYVIHQGRTTGITLRHELIHASGNPMEHDTDMAALQQIQEASKILKEQGDDKKYWIVFTTKEGQTITQSIQDPSVM